MFTYSKKPPSEAQLNCVRKGGMRIPKEVTIPELWDLVWNHFENDRPATDRHKSWAGLFGVEFTKFTGKKVLFDRIQSTLSEVGREEELLAWFTFRVYRNLVRGKVNVPIQNPGVAAIQEIAHRLKDDLQIVKSIRRYKGRDLRLIGTFDGYAGGSSSTIAYKRVSRLLRERLGREMIIKCGECNAEISNKAASCPKCGNPQTMQKIVVENKITGGGDIIHRIAVWGIIIFIIVGFIGCLASGS